MLKMSGPRMWLYVRCKSSPAQTGRGKPDQTRSLPRKGYIWTIGRWSGGPLIRAWSWFDSKMVHQN